MPPEAAQDLEGGGPQWVVRGGLAEARSLIEGYGPQRDIEGLVGLSVQYQPGVSREQLASVGFPNAQISYATEQELAAAVAPLGYELRLQRTPGWGDYHSTLSILQHGMFLTELPLDAAEALSAAFKSKMPNPNRLRRE